MWNKAFTDFKKFRVKPGKSVNLKNHPTEFKGKTLTKQWGEELLEIGRNHLAQVQERLYAQDLYAVLIIFQAIDAAGKDSAIKHIMSGFNPQGVKVHSFKTPTPQELDHHYLWRHSLALPARGEIAIHNRSHYENVLITRVHPAYILNEHLPGVDALDKINGKFWDQRLAQINQFEKTLSQNGTVIMKFFLHLSMDEQKKRFLERIDDPSKNWKFSAGDLKVRDLWDDYQRVYEQAISATSKKHAPWFIIPADDKWYTRLAIAAIISEQFENLPIHFPKVSKQQLDELAHAREILTSEKPGKPRKTNRKK
jgi:PPK2 family polyphosphate:nucleotide phosphotransferase